MPYNYKQEAAKYMEKLRTSTDTDKKKLAFMSIIGMMWQEGVDDVTKLPEEPRYAAPQILAAELYHYTPISDIISGLTVDGVVMGADVSTPQAINDCFAKFKAHEKLQDPNVIEGAQARRQLHAKGKLSTGELEYYKKYDPEDLDDGASVFTLKIELPEDEVERLKQLSSDMRLLYRALPDLDDYTGIHKELFQSIKNAGDLLTTDRKNDVRTDANMLEAHRMLEQLPDLLDEAIDTPEEFADIALYSDGMTLYDLVDENLKQKAWDDARDLRVVLERNYFKIPNAVTKVQERKNKLLEKEAQAKQKIEESGMVPIGPLRAQLKADLDKGEDSKVSSLANLWVQAAAEASFLPAPLRAKTEKMKKKAQDLTAYWMTDKKDLTNESLLDLYENTKELPALLATEVDTPDYLQEDYGQKMTYLSLFRERNRKETWTSFAKLKNALGEVNDYYKLGINIDELIEKSKAEMDQAKDLREAREQQRKEAEWQKDRPKQDRYEAGEREKDDAALKDIEAALVQNRRTGFANAIQFTFQNLIAQMETVKKGDLLYPLKEKLSDAMSVAAQAANDKEDRAMELAGKVLDIRAEVKRLTEHKKIRKDPQKKEIADSILRRCNGIITGETTGKIIAGYEEIEDRTQIEAAEKETAAKEASDLEEHIAKKQRALLESKAADCKTLQETADYKKTLTNALAEIIAGKLLIKAMKKSGAQVSENEQKQVIDKDLPQYAEEIKKDQVFVRMMDKVSLSPKALDELRLKGANGSELFEELDRHAKFVKSQEAEAEATRKEAERSKKEEAAERERQNGPKPGPFKP